jgi:hypothetical protein
VHPRAKEYVLVYCEDESDGRADNRKETEQAEEDDIKDMMIRILFCL